MILYQIQDKCSGIWWKEGPNQGTFTYQAGATIFLLREDANHAVLMLKTWAKQEGYTAFNPVVCEFDPFAAIKVRHEGNEMIFYQIFDENSCTWFKLGTGHEESTWVERQEATLWTNRPEGQIKIIGAANDRGDLLQRSPVILPYDIWEARQVLHDLNAAMNLGSLIYDVRAREDRGQEGPLVTAWREACRRARGIMQ